MTEVKIITQDQLFDLAKDIQLNTIITRQLTSSCIELYEFDKTDLNTKSIRLPRHSKFLCYMCGKKFKTTHPVYIFCCVKCGNLNQMFRHLSINLDKYTAIVTGSRTKLGHQIVMKLLRAGCSVIKTTRYPIEAMNLYEKYSDFEKWKNNLTIYPESFDLDVSNIAEKSQILCDFAREKFGKLDILVNCAAQTIRVREKKIVKDSWEIKDSVDFMGCSSQLEIDTLTKPQNRYGDAKYVEKTSVNSWQMTLFDLE